MNKKIQILVGIFLVAVAGTAIFLVFFEGKRGSVSNGETFQVPTAPNKNEEERQMSEPDQTIVVTEETSLPTIEEPVLPTATQEVDPAVRAYMGSYEPYSAERLAQASGDVVLFFRNSSCNSCQKLDNNIRANLTSIPKDIIILDVNFDIETALREKYAVTSLHTLVQVEPNGLLISKWQGSVSLAELLQSIK